MNWDSQCQGHKDSVHLSLPGKKLSEKFLVFQENCRELQIISLTGAKGECEGATDNKAGNKERNGVTKGLIY